MGLGNEDPSLSGARLGSCSGGLSPVMAPTVLLLFGSRTNSWPKSDALSCDRPMYCDFGVEQAKFAVRSATRPDGGRKYVVHTYLGYLSR